MLENVDKLKNQKVDSQTISKEVEIEILDHKIVSFKKELCNYIHIKENDQMLYKSQKRPETERAPLSDNQEYYTADQIISSQALPQIKA